MIGLIDAVYWLMILLALVGGYALGRAGSRREVREAKADAMRFVSAKQIAGEARRTAAEHAAGMVP